MGQRYVSQTSFVAGELREEMLGDLSTDAFQRGLAKVVNFDLLEQGGMRKRTGFDLAVSFQKPEDYTPKPALVGDATDDYEFSGEDKIVTVFSDVRQEYFFVIYSGAGKYVFLGKAKGGEQIVILSRLVMSAPVEPGPQRFLKVGDRDQFLFFTQANGKAYRPLVLEVTNGTTSFGFLDKREVGFGFLRGVSGTLPMPVTSWRMDGGVYQGDTLLNTKLFVTTEDLSVDIRGLGSILNWNRSEGTEDDIPKATDSPKPADNVIGRLQFTNRPASGSSIGRGLNVSGETAQETADRVLNFFGSDNYNYVPEVEDDRDAEGLVRHNFNVLNPWAHEGRLEAATPESILFISEGDSFKFNVMGGMDSVMTVGVGPSSTARLKLEKGIAGFPVGAVVRVSNTQGLKLATKEDTAATTENMRGYEEYKFFQRIRKGKVFGFFISSELAVSEDATVAARDVLFMCMAWPRIGATGTNIYSGYEIAVFPYVTSEGERVDGKAPSNEEPLADYGVTRLEAEFILKTTQSFRVFDFDHFNEVDGYPSAGYYYQGRLFLTGKDMGGRVAVSSNLHPFSFSNYLPRQQPYSPPQNIQDEIKAAREQGSPLGTLLAKVLPPTQDAPFEVVYWYRYFVSGGSTGGFEYALPVQDKARGSEVHWLSSIRTLLAGTNRAESAEVSSTNQQLNALSFNLRSEQSNRGSSSPITEKGDYSLFFVNREGDGLNAIFYDDGVSGYRSRNVNHGGGNYFDAGILTMGWDADRDCLFVLSNPDGDGNSRLGAFFLKQEYELSGWVEYKTNFFELDTIASIESFGDELVFRQGSFNTDGTLNSYRLKKRSEMSAFADGMMNNVESRVEFFKAVATSSKGELRQVPLQVGRTAIIYKTASGFDVETRSGTKRTYNSPPHTSEDVLIVSDIQAGMLNNVLIPRLKVLHSRREDFLILGTSSLISYPISNRGG